MTIARHRAALLTESNQLPSILIGVRIAATSPPRFRFMLTHLRNITSCVVFTLCIMFAALWVRSYSTKDVLWARWGNQQAIRVATVRGCVIQSVKRAISADFLTVSHVPVSKRQGGGYPDDFGRSPDSRKIQVLHWSYGLTEYHFPIWLLVLTTALVASAIRPRPRFKFSLRDLFILTTVAALIVGSVAYCLRSIG